MGIVARDTVARDSRTAGSAFLASWRRRASKRHAAPNALEIEANDLQSLAIGGEGAVTLGTQTED
jgi:hypothetical protein